MMLCGSLLPCELVRQVWQAAMGDLRPGQPLLRRAGGERVLRERRWWPLWAALHRRAAADELERKALVLAEEVRHPWERWWSRQPVPRSPLPAPALSAVVFGRLARGCVVWCDIGEEIWVGRVRGILQKAERCGTWRRVSVGDWCLICLLPEGPLLGWHRRRLNQRMVPVRRWSLCC